MKQQSVSRLDTQSREESVDERNCCERAMSCLADFCECDRKLFLMDQPSKDVEDYENFNELRTERMRSFEKYPRDLRLDQESKEDLNRFKSCFTLQWWVDFLCCRSGQQMNMQDESVNSQKHLQVHEKTVEDYHNDKQPYILDLKDSQVLSANQDGIPKKKSDVGRQKNLNILVRETNENDDIVNIDLEKNSSVSPSSQVNGKKIHVKPWEAEKRSNNKTPDSLISQKSKHQSIFDQKLEISPIPSPNPVKEYKNELNDFVFTDDTTLENQKFMRNQSGINGIQERKNGSRMKLQAEKLTYEPETQQTTKQALSAPVFEPYSQQQDTRSGAVSRPLQAEAQQFIPDDLDEDYQVNTRKNRLRGKNNEQTHKNGQTHKNEEPFKNQQPLKNQRTYQNQQTYNDQPFKNEPTYHKEQYQQPRHNEPKYKNEPTQNEPFYPNEQPRHIDPPYIQQGNHYEPEPQYTKPAYQQQPAHQNEYPYEQDRRPKIQQSQPRQQVFQEKPSGHQKPSKTSHDQYEDSRDAFASQKRNQSQLAGNYQSLNVNRRTFDEPTEQPIGRYDAQFNQLNSFSNADEAQNEQIRDMKKKKKKNIAAPREDYGQADRQPEGQPDDQPMHYPSSNFESSEPPSFADIVPDIKKKKRNKFLRGDKEKEEESPEAVTDIKKKKRNRVDLKHEYVQQIQIDRENF